MGDIDWSWSRDKVLPEYYERALAPLLRLPARGSRILEIGVGCGYVLSRLTASCDGHGTGVDKDAQSLSVTRQIAADLSVELTLVRSDGQRLPFADGSFDVVYSQGVIEHFPPSVASLMMDEHARVVRPGGLVAVSVPNKLNLFHTWLKWRQGPRYRFAPERSYTPGALREVLVEHGIAVRGVDGYGLFWSLWHHPSRLAYYTTAVMLRLGLDQEFETHLSAWLRSRLCMMTLAWGERV